MVAQSREIEEHRRFTSLIIDSLPVGLYVVDREYRIQVWNRKRETGTQGLRRDEVVGRPVFEVLTRQPAEQLRAEFDRVFQTGEIQQSELEVTLGNEVRFFRLSKIPMRLDRDAITHVITIGEDVTDSRAVQGRIMQSEKLAAVGQLAAGVMHEINNPLATIGACVAAIQGKLEDGQATAGALGEYLDIIDREVERCSRIVDGLLDFSRPKGQTKAPLSVTALVDETLFLLKHHQRFKRMTVERELEPELPRILGNKEQLIQVLMALLLNAVDAMEQTGRLTVRAARAAHERRGRGGGRGHRRRHPAGGPVQDLRAVLHHQAARPRHRARTLDLLRHRGGPPGPDRGGQRPGTGSDLPGLPAGGAMKILVVEDDRTVGQYVKRGLEEQRYQADLVDDGMEGLRLASGGRYDLIVLDLRLPGMNGFEMLRTLRDRGNTTPVLVLTAQDSVDFKVQALRAGADDYVTKPFAFEELLARVEALGRRPKEIRDPVLRVGDLELDIATREVRRAGERIDLTPKEYTVLEYLMRHAGRVMSRTLITEYAWDYHFDPGTNIVDVVINRLRKKVDSGHSQKLVHTVRGVGYVVKA